MADLRSLSYALAATAGTAFPTEFLVYNTSICSPNNGGQCCLFTVPAGKTWVTFEIWGGGGSGGGSCCCQQGYAGGSGTYTMKTVCSSSLAGCQYTICAASSSGCSSSTAGCFGSTTWVTGYGLSNFCACGGGQGCTDCFRFASCYHCYTGTTCCNCATGGDFYSNGFYGPAHTTQFCYNMGHQFAPVPPMTVSGPLVGPGGCAGIGYQGFQNPIGYFPGGGGFSAQTYGGPCCWSQPGAGGLVSVTYG